MDSSGPYGKARDVGPDRGAREADLYKTEQSSLADGPMLLD